MTEDTIKTGVEILDEYFKKLIQNQDIDVDLRKIMTDLWEQKRLNTATYLVRELDSLIEKKSK